MIALTCASCQQKLSVKEDLAGKKVKCPGCAQPLLVPGKVETPTRAAASVAAGGELPTMAPADRTAAPRFEQPTAPRPRRPDAPQGNPHGGLTDFLAPPQADDELGRLGGFRILKILGHGGMGVVFQAEDPKLGRQVALKAMLPHVAGSKSGQERFLREARAAAALEHEHIVAIHHVGEDRGAPFIVMPFLKGEPLDARLERDKQLPTAEVLRIGREIARGLGAAHAAGLIHRDIKPANVWLEAPDGRVKILDFGLARPSTADSDLTQQGAIVGTPAYMAPEQGDGTAVDGRCDLWSLGVVLYRMCTGQPPFQGAHTFATLAAVATHNPPPPAQLNRAVPAGLSDLVMNLLAKDPARRVASAEAVVGALRDLEQQQQATPVMPNPPPPIPRVVAQVTASPPLKKPLTTATRKAGHVTAPKDPDDTAGPVPGRKRRQPRRARKYGKLLLLVGLLVLVAFVSAAIVLFWKPAHALVRTDNGQVIGSADIAVAPRPPLPPPPPLPPSFTNSLGMVFALVPRGKSWLGGGGGTPGDQEVEIPNDFYLGAYEVTQEEWQTVMGNNPSYYARLGGGKDAVKAIPDADLKRFPVENVSWDDAQVFLTRLNARAKEAGWRYRLPTATEWEYACRGGPLTNKLDSAFDFYFEKPTNLMQPQLANYDKRLGRPCKVGSYRPNRLGLYDMHGNVGEWCNDVIGTPRGQQRVARGGGWNNAPSPCKASHRHRHPPSLRQEVRGLRLARVPVVTSS